MTKRFITRYYKQTPKGTECWAGVNILAKDFNEAQEKINIHNKTAEHKLILDGEFIEEVEI